MMRCIYEKASHVYVCLGKDRNARLAMAMVNELVLTFLVSAPILSAHRSMCLSRATLDTEKDTMVGYL